MPIGQGAENGPSMWDSPNTLSIREAQLVAAAVRILARTHGEDGGEIVLRLYGEAVLREAVVRMGDASP